MLLDISTVIFAIAAFSVFLSIILFGSLPQCR